MVSHLQGFAVKFLKSNRGLAVIAALLLILFLFRPGVYRLRNRIATSIGTALGRRVAIDNVHFHLLPRPGFALEGLVIYDDPEFSEEPMIRADEVSAAIRFRSLFRGRLEIATLSANEPSINLVRNGQGRWNLASLLERNAQIPAAPTEKSTSATRPVFPYLEASNARVNFKLGQTKKSYALMNADVALWQDSENSWSARIQAEPVRTDFHLTDTGVVQINATWRRASTLRLTPLEITAQWRKGQLGQITQLLSGNDRGWRGGVTFAAKLSGTPEALRLESQATIDDFRRYDLVDSENVHLGATCSGLYDAVTGELGDLLCQSPVGGGTVRLHGTARVVAQAPAYDLTLAIEKIPLTSVARLLRHTKKQIPGDLTATGLLSAEFHAKNELGNAGGVPNPSVDTRLRHLAQWTGTGSATDVRLISTSGSDEIAFGTIPLALLSHPVEPAVPRKGASKNPDVNLSAHSQQKDQEPADAHLRIGPVALSMNGSAPVNAVGWISADGYLFSLRGEAELKDLFRLDRVLGLPVTRPAAEGSVRLDVSVSGSWRGFAPPLTLGVAQLRNVRAEMRGLNTPIEIGSATISLTPDTVTMQKISARTGTTHWSGLVTVSRHCTAASASSDAIPGAAPNCLFQFDLSADQLSAVEVDEWLTPHPAKRPWYRILNSASSAGSDSNASGSPHRSPLLAIQARGTLHASRFVLKKLVATQVVTQIEVDRGKITLDGMRAQLLQGTYQGTWILDASSLGATTPAVGESGTPAATAQSAPTVRFLGAGTLKNISLGQVATLMNDSWIDGTADGNFEVNGSANNFGELLSHSEGKLHFVMRNGALAHIEIPGSATLLPVHRFSGELQLKKGDWELSAGKMESRDGFFQLSGSATAASGWDFVFTRSDEQSWALTGTLAKPHITPLPRTEARRTDVVTPVSKP